MYTGASSRRRDRTAIGSSIALHVCVLAGLLAAPHSPSFPTEEPDERALLISIVRLPHATPPRPTAARPAVPVEHRSVPAATPGPLHVTVATEHSRRALIVAPEKRYVAPAPPAPRARNRSAPAEAAPIPQAPVQPAVVRASAAPTSAPTATVIAAATPAAAERDAGQGNFGESYPARPMPGMVDALRAKAPRLVAHVTVDERGHATSVVVVAGVDDAGLREEITRALLAATYIPASCNGLSCTQTFDLRT
ncbi:MAG: hypothetical protein QOI11_495 [Candidatus Eremiobacteraeota bacterium]|nr:hypothetical protein [Candidatus Eremiobacteraeota bacterium]